MDNLGVQFSPQINFQQVAIVSVFCYLFCPICVICAYLHCQGNFKGLCCNELFKASTPPQVITPISHQVKYLLISNKTFKTFKNHLNVLCEPNTHSQIKLHCTFWNSQKNHNHQKKSLSALKINSTHGTNISPN